MKIMFVEGIVLVKRTRLNEIYFTFEEPVKTQMFGLAIHIFISLFERTDNENRENDP